jgi:hypothetical protein
LNGKVDSEEEITIETKIEGTKKEVQTPRKRKLESDDQSNYF